MSGTLPGVACARRRRLHQGGGSRLDTSANARRFSSNQDQPLLTSAAAASLLHRHCYTEKHCYNYIEHEKLEDVVREAKERLHERLMKAEWKSEPRRTNRQERSKGAVERSKVSGNLQTETFGTKKLMNWAKFGGRNASNRREDCVVCLEEFKTGETIAMLSCAHRFHSNCLLPWLENKAQCPCCRKDVSAQIKNGGHNG